MPLFKRLLSLLTIVSLQKAGAQSIVTLPQSTNCAKGIFVDYVAKSKYTTDRKNILINGIVYTSNDTIKKIKIKALQAKPISKEIPFTANIALTDIKVKVDNKTEVALQKGIIFNNKEMSIEFVFTENTYDLGDIEINYQFELVNGCVFVLRQKIKQTNNN